MNERASGFIVRRALAEDIPSIQNLLSPFVLDEILLERSKEEIVRELSWTWVAESSASYQLLGVMNFSFFPPRFAEIRGLAVRKEAHGQGIGRQMVETAIRFLRSQHPEKADTIFALTYVPAFFTRLGFEIVPKEEFPPKIYEVCRFCNKQDNCKEIAVRLMI